MPYPALPWAALAGLLDTLGGEHATRTVLRRLRTDDRQNTADRETGP